MSDQVVIPGFASYCPYSVEKLWLLCTRTTMLTLRRFPAAALLLLVGCAGETLFQSNFDATPINQPPAHAQQVGTANIHGPAGSVIVVSPPVTPSGKWVRITYPGVQDVAGFQGNFSAFRGDGQYDFSATLFMPFGSSVASIQ